METAQLAAEFTKSTNKAIKKLSEKFGFAENEIQISVTLDKEKESVYEICKNYSVKSVISEDDVVKLPVAYVMIGAKAKVLHYINKALIKIAEYKASEVRVFILKSTVRPEELRMMLYVAGVYDSDITAEQIIESNN